MSARLDASAQRSSQRFAERTIVQSVTQQSAIAGATKPGDRDLKSRMRALTDQMLALDARMQSNYTWRPSSVVDSLVTTLVSNYQADAAAAAAQITIKPDAQSVNKSAAAAQVMLVPNLSAWQAETALKTSRLAIAKAHARLHLRSVVKIQRAVRAWLPRLRWTREQLGINHSKGPNAALLPVLRSHRSLLLARANAHKGVRFAPKALRDKAALAIQRVYRGHLARRLRRRLLLSKEASILSSKASALSPGISASEQAQKMARLRELMLQDEERRMQMRARRSASAASDAAPLPASASSEGVGHHHNHRFGSAGILAGPKGPKRISIPLSDSSSGGSKGGSFGPLSSTPDDDVTTGGDTGGVLTLTLPPVLRLGKGSAAISSYVSSDGISSNNSRSAAASPEPGRPARRRKAPNADETGLSLQQQSVTSASATAPVTPQRGMSRLFSPGARPLLSLGSGQQVTSTNNSTAAHWSGGSGSSVPLSPVQEDEGSSSDDDADVKESKGSNRSAGRKEAVGFRSTAAPDASAHSVNAAVGPSHGDSSKSNNSGGGLRHHWELGPDGQYHDVSSGSSSGHTDHHHPHHVHHQHKHEEAASGITGVAEDSASDDSDGSYYDDEESLTSVIGAAADVTTAAASSGNLPSMDDITEDFLAGVIQAAQRKQEADRRREAESAAEKKQRRQQRRRHSKAAGGGSGGGKSVTFADGGDDVTMLVTPQRPEPASAGGGASSGGGRRPAPNSAGRSSSSGSGASAGSPGKLAASAARVYLSDLPPYLQSNAARIAPSAIAANIALQLDPRSSESGGGDGAGSLQPVTAAAAASAVSRKLAAAYPTGPIPVDAFLDDESGGGTFVSAPATAAIRQMIAKSTRSTAAARAAKSPTKALSSPQQQQQQQQSALIQSAAVSLGGGGGGGRSLASIDAQLATVDRIIVMTSEMVVASSSTGSALQGAPQAASVAPESSALHPTPLSSGSTYQPGSSHPELDAFLQGLHADGVILPGALPPLPNRAKSVLPLVAGSQQRTPAAVEDVAASVLADLALEQKLRRTVR